ncbi:unnamed protein product [Pleuronectes platessa]|uniref:Uncharacterized protein n=1 Tax=Pleuronectes platessa TaxID=8262 RepID=A0A9N7UZT6_PLEPL|nr:unnamed protein product [Pleuronectes platessa]
MHAPQAAVGAVAVCVHSAWWHRGFEMPVLASAQLEFLGWSGWAPRLEDVSSWPSLTICSVQKACTTGGRREGLAQQTQPRGEESEGKGGGGQACGGRKQLEGGVPGLTEEKKEAGGVERAGRGGWRRKVAQGAGWRGGGRGRAGLRCPGRRCRVVCYLSTSDQSHLLQGEGSEAGGGGSRRLEKTGEKVKKGADVRSKSVFHI